MTKKKAFSFFKIFSPEGKEVKNLPSLFLRKEIKSYGYHTSKRNRFIKFTN